MIMNRSIQQSLLAGTMALALGMTQWAVAEGLPVSVSAKVSGDVRSIKINGNAQDGAVIALPAGSVVTFTVTISNGVPLTVTLPPATVAVDMSRSIGECRPAGTAYEMGLLPVMPPRERSKDPEQAEQGKDRKGKPGSGQELMVRVSADLMIAGNE